MAIIFKQKDIAVNNLYNQISLKYPYFQKSFYNLKKLKLLMLGK